MNTVSCKGTNKNGQPCGATLGIGSTGFCIAHDPDRVAERRSRWEAGGRASAESKRKRRTALPANVPRLARSLDDAVIWTAWAVHAVAIGEIDARTCHEVCFGMTQFKGAVEKRDLTLEIEKLRAELEEAKARLTPNRSLRPA